MVVILVYFRIGRNVIVRVADYVPYWCHPYSHIEYNFERTYTNRTKYQCAVQCVYTSMHDTSLRYIKKHADIAKGAVRDEMEKLAPKRLCLYPPHIRKIYKLYGDILDEIEEMQLEKLLHLRTPYSKLRNVPNPVQYRNAVEKFVTCAKKHINLYHDLPRHNTIIYLINRTFIVPYASYKQ